MFWGDKPVLLPHTGWRPDQSGKYDLRYYQDGAATARVGVETSDDRSGAVVTGFGFHLARRAGRLVVREEKSGFRFSSELTACVAADVNLELAEDGCQVLRLDLEVRAATDLPVTAHLVLRFPYDCWEELERIIAAVRVDHVPASPDGHVRDRGAEQQEHWREPDPHHGHDARQTEYFFETPPVGSVDRFRVALGAEVDEPAHGEREAVVRELVEPVVRPPELPRITVRAVPDNTEWTSFQPLSTSGDVLLFADGHPVRQEVERR